VEVYNLIGTRIKSLASGAFPAGRSLLNWDGRNEAGHPAASGVYIVRLSYGQASIERSLSLIR
jgi:flagellar hook assembly protein FlgD